jgi:hypothetical protein
MGGVPNTMAKLMVLMTAFLNCSFSSRPRISEILRSKNCSLQGGKGGEGQQQSSSRVRTVLTADLLCRYGEQMLVQEGLLLPKSCMYMCKDTAAVLLAR